MIQKKAYVFIIIFLCIVSVNTFAKNKSKPALMLANIYHEGIDLDQYWVSEKYDGVRALWDGKKLISRGGNTYVAPAWFIKNFPKENLDGELWVGRQKFEVTLSIVKDQIPNDKAWKKVKFMVFDLPDMKKTFDKRLPYLTKLISRTKVSWLKAVKQWKVSSHSSLQKQLNEITQQGAEGLMLHRGSSFYKGKRSGDLLKVKSHQDAEATVIKHISGKGKYKNMLGALVVEMPNKLRFKIGTGFSDYERNYPPKIGQTITYRYRGQTRNGIPRFASFLRIREIEK